MDGYYAIDIVLIVFKKNIKVECIAYIALVRICSDCNLNCDDVSDGIQGTRAIFR